MLLVKLYVAECWEMKFKFVINTAANNDSEIAF